MTVDSFLGTISVPPDKKARLASFLEDFFFRREATLSELASLRGRIQHYSAGIPYILPFVALISSVIGTDGDPVYDTPVSVPPIVCRLPSSSALSSRNMPSQAAPSCPRCRARSTPPSRLVTLAPLGWW
jgi:hypothetical protein